MTFSLSLGMDPQTAITTAKRCRSIIDPIGQLPEFLQRLYLAYLHSGGSPFMQKLQLAAEGSSSSSAAASTLEDRVENDAAGETSESK